jgi:hypothetical protein
VLHAAPEAHGVLFELPDVIAVLDFVRVEGAGDVT